MLWKNHLVLGLQALKRESVRWDPDDSRINIPPMTPNTQELHETLELGLWVERSSYAAITEDEEAVRYLCISNIFDQTKAMPGHEAEYLWHIWEASKHVPSAVNKTH